jgi:hypothetical protein
MKNKQIPNSKEKVVKNKTASNKLTAKKARKELNVAVVTNNEFPGANFDIGHISKMSSLIKVSDMFVDYSYQREPLKAKISRITKNFDPDLLGVITCSMREDNTLAIIDGSHRYHALIAMGMKNANVNALVYFGLSIEDEAHIFALTNKEHTKPTPAQIFKAGIVAGDKACIAINDVVEKSGAKIHFSPGPNNIRCVATLRKVYDNAGSSVLLKTLQTLKSAYPNNNEMFRDQMISAVGCIYNRYGKKVDQDRLIETLTKLGNPSLVIAQAQAMISSGQVVTFTTLPYLIVSRYNVKLKVNRLTDFPMNLLAQQVWTSKG